MSDLVQGDKTGDVALDEKVKQYIKVRYNKPGNVFLGVVHRIDRPVSGAVIFAKTSKALARMNTLFREKNIIKTYWAIVKNPLPNLKGTLVHYMVRNQKQNKSYTHTAEVKDSKMAVLHYHHILSSDKYHLLQVTIETGRHHQIRAQLSAVGAPIKGDLKYGFPRSNPDGGISLHARSVAFLHPVTKEKLFIEAPPPVEPLWNYFLEEIKKP